MDFDPAETVAIVASAETRARLRALLENAGWHVAAEADSLDELAVPADALVAVVDAGADLKVGPYDHKAYDRKAGPYDLDDDGAVFTEALTSREHDVLEALSDGLSNRDIATRLGISEHTVKFHLASIYGKLGASTRAQAIRRGFRRGLITL
jgi:DNA-binding CsgD family transcriptional regulator